MNKNKRLKKGFTLVELVVVIAVIAILAAVSVGAYFGITESANRSADEQAVTQLNKMLETYEILTGRVDDVEEAKDIFEDNGVTNYTPFFDKNTFYWTHADSRVIIWTEGKGVTFPSWAAENYKSYSEKGIASADWYDLNVDYNNLIELEADENGVVYVMEYVNGLKSVTNNGTIVFPKDSVMSDSAGHFYYTFKYATNADTVNIDLNGATLNVAYGITANFVKKTIVFENGTINCTGNTNLFQVGDNSKVLLRNMKITSTASGSNLIYCEGDAGEVIIENCEIEGFNYGVGTNANHSSMPIYTIKKSSINATVPVFLNVPGKVTIEDSKLISSMVALALKSGSLYAKNTYIYTEPCTEDAWAYHKNYAQWFGLFSEGAICPTTVVLLGSYTNHSAYKGDVKATFENCEFDADNPNGVMTVPDMLLAADNYTSVDVKYSNCDINPANIIHYDATPCGNPCTDHNYQGHGGHRLETNVGTISINGTVYGYDNYNGYSKYSYNG